MFRKVFSGDESDNASPLSFLGGARAAVVDIETTGLYPYADRIVEIAIVGLDVNGTVSDEFATLINPQRDVGPTRIHGISAGDVLDAPTFTDVAGDIATRLSARIIVAHNVQFDLEFLKAEFLRIGCSLPSMPTLCTMMLAQELLQFEEASRLDALCQHLSIPQEQAHSALSDARATAQLLGILLRRASSIWPGLKISGRAYTREEAAKRVSTSHPRPSEKPTLRPGLSVCFTGTSQLTLDGSPFSRAMAEELAREAGLVVKRSVTKDLDMLVVADFDSQSGKAQMARRHGIQLVAELAFWESMGLRVGS